MSLPRESCRSCSIATSFSRSFSLSDCSCARFNAVDVIDEHSCTNEIKVPSLATNGSEPGSFVVVDVVGVACAMDVDVFRFFTDLPS